MGRETIPNAISLGSRWVLAPTESKINDLGLSDVFHPTAGSPAVDGASTEVHVHRRFLRDRPLRICTGCRRCRVL